jgi:choice-of-anchor B domain-containing protein
MKKLIIAFVLFFTLVLTLANANTAFSQLPNQNMYLLKNLNQHFTSTLYSAVWGYAAPDGREYALLGCPTGTAFIDVTDSANIVEVDYLTGVTSAWREMKTYSHYAYIVSEGTNSRLQIVDLQYLPDSVHLVKTWNYTGYTRTHSISQAGHYLYLNGGNSAANGGITILDVIDPVNPVKMGQWTTLYVHDCRVEDDTIYAANINDGKVSIINATNKSQLSTVISFNNLIASGPHNTALSKDRKRLFVTDEIGNAPYLLKVWNIENKSNITYVTSWQPTGITSSIVHNIETYGDYGIIAHYSAGVRIINIANPDAPVEIAWYDTYPLNNNESYNGCWGVYLLPSGKIIASDRQTGLYVLKTSFALTGTGGSSSNTVNSVPENFSLDQNYPNPFNPSTIINYQLPTANNVTLKVYDETGKEISTLFSGYQSAGYYNITFNASGLSSGIYFYALKAGEFNLTKKMLLIK